MIELLGLNIADLESVIVEHNFPKFRAKQLIDYIYKRHIFNFEEMLQLPKNFRTWLQENCTLSIPKIIKVQETSNSDTVKLLLELTDKSKIETVLMKQRYGNSVCVSTQVGCAMGCIFCASTRNGLLRNLTAAEIIAQVLLFKTILKEDIHSIVYMGAGEPLQNYDNVLKSIHLLHDDSLFNISYRKITVSTCGLVEGIKRLAQENIPITLALSLHGSNDAVRNQIMPISKKYALNKVIEALKYYFDITRRKITFEYILIDEVNVSKNHALELVRLLKDFKVCNINLIPVNGNEHINLVKPNRKTLREFVSILEKNNFEVVIRKEMGDSIQAACGQLKIQYE